MGKRRKLFSIDALRIWDASASSRATAFVMIAVNAVIAAGALVLVAMMLAQDRRYRDLVPRLRSVSGTTEAGTVEQGERGGKRTRVRYYRVLIPFVYEVSGRALRSDDYELNHQPEFSTADEAQAFLERFPAGTAVTVWYDPDDPGEAALEPRYRPMGSSGFLWAMLAIGLGLLFAVIRVSAALRRDMRDRPLPVPERRKVLTLAGGTAALGALAAGGALAWDGWDHWSHYRRAPHLRQVSGWLEYVQARSSPDRVEVTYQYALPGEPPRSRPGNQWRFGRQRTDAADAEAFEKRMDRQVPFAEVWYDARHPANSALQPLHVPHFENDVRVALLAGSLLFGYGAARARRGLRRIASRQDL